MKKGKYLILAVIVFFLLAVYLYYNFVYYTIPFNPINQYATETLADFHITQNPPNGDTITAKCKKPNTCRLVLEYFTNLKLVPLKYKVARNMISEQGKGIFLTGMLKFSQSNEIFISDIFLDNPTILYISSPTPGFRGEGYYKIVDTQFNYKYIYDLIRISEN